MSRAMELYENRKRYKRRMRNVLNQFVDDARKTANAASFARFKRVLEAVDDLLAASLACFEATDGDDQVQMVKAAGRVRQAQNALLHARHGG